MINNATGAGFAISDDINATGVVYIYNNTTYESSTAPISANYFIDNDNVIMKNNLMYSNTSGTGRIVNYGVGTTVISDYNLFYAPNADSLIRYDGDYYHDLAAWQVVLSQDINSVQGNPAFTADGSD